MRGTRRRVVSSHIEFPSLCWYEGTTVLPYYCTTVLSRPPLPLSSSTLTYAGQVVHICDWDGPMGARQAHPCDGPMGARQAHPSDGPMAHKLTRAEGGSSEVKGGGVKG